MKIDDLGLFGPSRDASRTSLGVSWRPPGSLKSRRKANLGCLGASWATLWGAAICASVASCDLAQ
eukprot:8216278-Pyramimonas_sp.AAC.1